ncbi:MAG: hypothetical protein K2U26_06890 [Cyclobacteriaceae bacterium]|nr:hypothetical protein [Cyclobacteriaceae bacterium]
MRIQFSSLYYFLRNAFVLTGISLACSLSLYSQVKTLESLTKDFTNFSQQNLQEKIFVHTDRDYYLTGEMLWFKVYYVEGSFHTPLKLSSVAYVELLDATLQPVAQAKIDMQEGGGHGSFFLPASLSTGHYTLKAYTQWMRNYSTDFFFRKTIEISNPFVRSEEVKKASVTQNDIQFFPEGGRLVAGLPSKVGVKAINSNGMGIDFSGTLVSDLQDTILHFKPLAFGMGSFTFTPLAGRKYRAMVKSDKGVQNIPLPEAEPSGYVLSVIRERTDIKIDASVNPQQSETPIYLFINRGMAAVHKETGRLKNGKCSFLVKEASLPPGANLITIFNAYLEPVAERLYFKKPDKSLFAIVADKSNYQKRQAVRLGIKGTPRSSISVAVFKDDSLANPHRGHIQEYLFLSSDLNGHIEHPEFYLSDAPNSLEAVDNLMLTQGWRRFAWKEITYFPLPKFLPELNGPIVRGRVMKQGKAAPGTLSYLGAPSQISNAYASRSNPKGEIYFEMQKFWGNRQVYAQPVGTDSSQIELDNPFAKEIAPTIHPSIDLPKFNEKAYLDRSVAMQVMDIYHKKNLLIQSPPLLDSGAFYGKADESYLLDDYTRFPTMEEVLREYVKGVFVRKKNEVYQFMVINGQDKGLFQQPPFVLLDGVVIRDHNKIMEIDPLLIKKIDVVRKTFFLGQVTCSGIINFQTYTGDVSAMSNVINAAPVTYDGLQLQREFYSPRYRSEKRSDRLPDFRYLLQWSPDIRLDNSGEASLELFTSDCPGRFQIILEGISPDGRAGSATNFFYVNR